MNVWVQVTAVLLVVAVVQTVRAETGSSVETDGMTCDESDGGGNHTFQNVQSDAKEMYKRIRTAIKKAQGLTSVVKWHKVCPVPNMTTQDSRLMTSLLVFHKYLGSVLEAGSRNVFFGCNLNDDGKRMQAIVNGLCRLYQGLKRDIFQDSPKNNPTRVQMTELRQIDLGNALGVLGKVYRCLRKKKSFKDMEHCAVRARVFKGCTTKGKKDRGRKRKGKGRRRKDKGKRKGAQPTRN